MSGLAFELQKAMEDAGLQLVGVVIGREDDKTTWRAVFLNEPSEEQQAVADGIIEKFDSAAVAFVTWARIQLSHSDQDMARVTEDLVDLLISKGVITNKELPDSVMALLADRKAARAVVSDTVLVADVAVAVP